MYLCLLCWPVFSPAINGIGEEEGVTVTVNVSIVVSEDGVDPSVVPVGPAVVNVQKSNLSVQTSTNDIKELKGADQIPISHLNRLLDYWIWYGFALMV